MTALTLYFHPLASFCWKVLVPLYENETPFEPVLVDKANAESLARFEKVWPVAKFPVLHDHARDLTIPESTIIVEHLDTHFPGKTKLIPKDVDRARAVRLADRFYDNYVHQQMQRVVSNRLRPKENKDPFGVDEAKKTLSLAYDMIENDMKTRSWACGEDFTLADCAAFPALYYGNEVHPFGASHPNVKAYLDRLHARPSVKRVLEEAGPYLHMFPKD